jgi:hypothetical protein
MSKKCKKCGMHVDDMGGPTYRLTGYTPIAGGLSATPMKWELCGERNCPCAKERLLTKKAK